MNSFVVALIALQVGGCGVYWYQGKPWLGVLLLTYALGNVALLMVGRS